MIQGDVIKLSFQIKKPRTLEDANDTVIKLHFICYDPFKYTEPKTVTTNKVTYNGDSQQAYFGLTTPSLKPIRSFTEALAFIPK